METSENSDPNDEPRAFKKARLRTAAFSLVEIALALGIMAFALVSVFGLLPIGLTTFRKASDISVSAQIAQAVIGEAQQTDYDTLLGSSHVNQITPFSKAPIRYFDYQGGEQTTQQLATTIYWVNTRIVPSTSIPTTNAATNQDLATVTVQVASNSSNIPLTLDTATGLWQPKSGISILSFSTYVARNSPPVITPN